MFWYIFRQKAFITSCKSLPEPVQFVPVVDPLDPLDVGVAVGLVRSQRRPRLLPTPAVAGNVILPCPALRLALLPAGKVVLVAQAAKVAELKSKSKLAIQINAFLSMYCVYLTAGFGTFVVVPTLRVSFAGTGVLLQRANVVFNLLCLEWE